MPVPQSNTFILTLGSYSVRLTEDRDREMPFVYFVQIALRGREEKKKERRVHVEITSCTVQTEGEKSLMSKVSVAETEAEKQC